MFTTLMVGWFGPNWRPALGGVMVGVPPIVSAAAIAAALPLGKWAVFIGAMSIGIGGLILGTNSKDKQVHSTQAQVRASTVQAAVVTPVEPAPIVAIPRPVKPRGKFL